MTRCLNCGAERDGDQCLACGLTSPAAEVMLRKRLVWRTGWFLVGAVLFLPVSQAFPPLELDSILIFVGVLFFVVFGLGILMVRLASQRKEIEIIKRLYFGLLPVPWILATLLFINGRFDTAQPKEVNSTVVGKFSMTGMVRPQRLVVNSWREGQRIERISVGQDDYDRFQIGDPVVVEVAQGLMGIPWVYGVHRP